MSELVLCEGSVRIDLRPQGGRAILTIANEDSLQFLLSRANLISILEGETIQLSHNGTFCKMTRQGDDIRVDYAWRGALDVVHCPAADLQKLLDRLTPN